MHEIIFDRKKHAWDSAARKFRVSEKDVAFAIDYRIVNTETGKSMDFHFSHSTGPEFDPNTKWIYINNDSGIALEVCNDPEITKVAAEKYLEAKLRKN